MVSRSAMASRTTMRRMSLRRPWLWRELCSGKELLDLDAWAFRTTHHLATDHHRFRSRLAGSLGYATSTSIPAAGTISYVSWKVSALLLSPRPQQPNRPVPGHIRRQPRQRQADWPERQITTLKKGAI